MNWLSLLMIAGILVGPQQDPKDSVTTKFDPAKDLPCLSNFAHPIFGKSGVCDGIDELSLYYFQRRMQANGRKFPNQANAELGFYNLKEMTDTIKKYHGEAYLKEILATARIKCRSDGPPLSAALKGPAFFENVVAKMKEHNEPQSIILVDEVTHKDHRVTVYGAEKGPNGWILKTADPNHAEKDFDKVTLSYDPVTKGLVTKVAGVAESTFQAGGLTVSPTKRMEDYFELMNRGVRGDRIQDIRYELKHPAPPVPEKTVTIEKDPKAGGVIMHFDPDLFDGTIDEAKLADLEKRGNEFLQSNQTGSIILQLEPQRKHLSLVPLSSLSPAKDLGGLTRVLGFVTKANGETYLAGLKESGHSPLPGEWLAIALQSIYANGQSPYISLDPDPSNFSGPQKVRIGDIPVSLRKTSFVLALLDADYLMKRINLGKEVPQVPGFKSWVSRLDATAQTGGFRMWFSPRSIPLADSFICRKGGDVAVLYESNVQVLSDSEKREQEMGTPSNEIDDISVRAAQNFTTRFPELSAKYPQFQRLSGAFDIAKLCTAWRSLRIKPTGLDAWLTYKPIPISVPESYEGIGPEETPDGKRVISGGATTRSKFKVASAVETDRLAPMLKVSSENTVDIELPSTMSIEGASAIGFGIEARLAQAKIALQHGRTSEALECADQVLSLDSEDEDARIVRAICLGLLKKYPECLAEFDRLVVTAPVLKATRAVFRATVGDVKGALDDAANVEHAYAENEAAIISCTIARFTALDVAGANLDLARLRLLCPASPVITSLESEITAITFMTPEQSRARNELKKLMPDEISMAIQSAIAQPGQTDSLHQALRDIESGRYVCPSELYIPDRLRIMIAVAATAAHSRPESIQESVEAADAIIRDHPNWATGYYAKFAVELAIASPPEDVVAVLRRFAELEDSPDPLLADIKLVTRMNRLSPTFSVLAFESVVPTSSKPSETLQLAIDLTKGSPGQGLLRTVQGAADWSIIEWIRTTGDTKMQVSREALSKTLQQCTAIASELKPNDPVYTFALSICACALTVFPPLDRETRIQESRAMQLAAQGPPQKMLVEYATSSRAKIWLMTGSSIIQRGADPLIIKDIDPLAEEMQRLITPTSPKTSMVKARATIGALAKQLQKFLNASRGQVSSETLQIRSKYGDLSADVITLIMAQTQAQFNTDQSGDYVKLTANYPGIEKSAEFAELKSVTESTKGGLFLKTNPELAWNSVLADIKTRYDGLTVLKVLELFRHAGNVATQAQVSRFVAQAKVKTELGTSGY